MFIQFVTLFVTAFLITICFGDPNPITSLEQSDKNPVDPDETCTIEELVARHGFILQSHKVTTEDGYFLTVHRPVPKDNYSEPDYTKNRKPVIFLHGLGEASYIAFINSPFVESGDNFGFSLVLTGRYDLWLVNSRANGQSDGHVTLSDQDSKYWEFSIDEMALYDTPAAIDMVRNKTGHQTVGLIGFSQGAAIGLGMLALKPEYAQVVQPFICWGASIYMGDMTSPMGYLTKLVEPIVRWNGGKYSHSDKLSDFLQATVCKLVNTPDCLYNMVIGWSTSLNISRLPVKLHFEATAEASNWNFAHFGQMVNRKSFTRFDYGFPYITNFAKYHQMSAPEYPLENIPPNFTIAIMRGTTDAIVVESDAQKLLSKLRGLGLNVIDYQVQKDAWNHVDFVFGAGAGKLVYEKTYEILDEYTKH